MWLPAGTHLFWAAVLVICLHGHGTNAGNIQGVARADDGTNSTFNVGFLLPWSSGWVLGPKMGSALSLGVQKVIDDNILPGYAIEWDWADTECNARVGLAAAFDLWARVDDLDAFIGGGCSEVCQTVGFIMTAFDLPLISFGCTAQELSNRNEYPTFTRTVGTWPSLAPLFVNFVEFFKDYNWNRLRVLATPEPIMQFTSNAISEAFTNAGYTDEGSYGVQNIESTIITIRADDGTTSQQTDDTLYDEMKEKLKQLKEETRVIILLMYDQDIRNTLVAAKDLDMMEGYIYIALDAALPADVEMEDGAPTVGETEAAYEGLISANLGVPQTQAWLDFADEVISEFPNQAKFASVDYLGKGGASASASDVDVHAGMLYDAVLTWAHGVNLTREAYGNDSMADSGTEITRILIEDTIGVTGITGQVVIDDEGSRNPDYNVEIIQDGNYVTLLTYQASGGTITKVYNSESETDWSGIVWKGGVTEIPEGQPECGWLGELCLKTDNTTTILIAVPVAVIALIVLSAIIFYFVNRHLKFEAELKSVSNWKVDWNDIQKNKQAEQIEQSRTTLHSSKTYDQLGGDKQLFCQVASYKGKMCAIKPIEKTTSVSIQDRTILVELKNTRDMNHENINVFVGACPDAPNMAILMVYAQKGSLQDVLQNDAIDLTWDFKMSLSTDIAKGMQYLHNSPFGSHGHLTSANTVVDSRWTCKITDYGMGLFKSGEKKPACDYDLIWTAPELLKSKPPMYGTKEGDYYSYGIILSEIITKDAPYAINGDVDAAEIVRRVKAGNYRPVIPDGVCKPEWIALMQRCWQESPEARANFSQILASLRQINDGKQINVVDNMIKILEQYAEHLEEMVAERTSQLTAEKKKVETLLLNILPKSVAACLMNGETVEPESFDSVTIYFSDIVGFSKLAAESNPLQIVELLNNLYNSFDEVVDDYEVYKVETINDAYMVASGLPERNGDKHAGEIATMALNLLSVISLFRIPHLPDRQLQLRIGINTGPCVAGVVGLKMPRYCLFGDTVNTASRMQSQSMALRANLSTSTADLLMKEGGFILECRGKLAVKGKGEMTCYWLNNKEGFNLPLPDLSKAASMDEHEFK